jgi:hypothetical protein
MPVFGHSDGTIFKQGVHRELCGVAYNIPDFRIKEEILWQEKFCQHYSALCFWQLPL